MRLRRANRIQHAQRHHVVRAQNGVDTFQRLGIRTVNLPGDIALVLAAHRQLHLDSWKFRQRVLKSLVACMTGGGGRRAFENRNVAVAADRVEQIARDVLAQRAVVRTDEAQRLPCRCTRDEAEHRNAGGVDAERRVIDLGFVRRREHKGVRLFRNRSLDQRDLLDGVVGFLRNVMFGRGAELHRDTVGAEARSFVSRIGEILREDGDPRRHDAIAPASKTRALILLDINSHC